MKESRRPAKTSYLRRLLCGRTFPRSFIIFIGHFNTSSLQMSGFDPTYYSCTLENKVLLNILWRRSWPRTRVLWQAIILLIGFNSVPTMTWVGEVSVIGTMDVVFKWKHDPSSLVRSSQWSISTFVLLTWQLQSFETFQCFPSLFKIIWHTADGYISTHHGSDLGITGLVSGEPSTLCPLTAVFAACPNSLWLCDIVLVRNVIKEPQTQHLTLFVSS